MKNGIWDLRRGKQTREALWLPELTALRKFPGLSTGTGNPGGAWRTPWVKKQRWNSRETKAARMCRTDYLRKKNGTKRKHQRSAENPTCISRHDVSANVWGRHSCFYCNSTGKKLQQQPYGPQSQKFTSLLFTEKNLLTPNIILNSKRKNAFLLRSGKR